MRIWLRALYGSLFLRSQSSCISKSPFGSAGRRHAIQCDGGNYERDDDACFPAVTQNKRNALSVTGHQAAFSRRRHWNCVDVSGLPWNRIDEVLDAVPALPVRVRVR